MTKIKEPAREGFLYHLWLERTFESIDLRTIDGQPVEILEKGERNFDAGPDFLNALVRIDDQLLRGDVEIHSIAGDWYAHGHHNDPRYNNVVLHIVTMECPASFRSIRQNGTLIPTLNLDAFLEKPAEELEEDNPAPEKPRSDCALRRESGDIIHRIIEHYGDKRFALKSARFAERRGAHSWDQLFYAALLEALGYAKNQIPFRHLAEVLPVDLLWRFVWNDPQVLALKKSEALLFGAAGLLPSQSTTPMPILDQASQHYVDTLERIWQDFPGRRKLEALKPGSWQFFRLRPANFPTRRIAAAAAFAVNFMDEGFVGSLTRVLTDVNFNPRTAARELDQLFVLAGHPFWSRHFKFDESAAGGKKEAAIIGVERARDIVVNVALPVLSAYAGETEDGRLKIAVSEIYNIYPRLKENEITRQMSERIFSSTKSQDIITGARMQQGLIHLSKEVCRPDNCTACLSAYSDM